MLKTYFDDYLPSVRLQSGVLLRSMFQGGQEMVEGRGWRWSMMGRLDDAHAFERFETL